MSVVRRGNLRYRLQVLLDWSRYQWDRTGRPASHRDRILEFITDAINMEFSQQELTIVVRLQGPDFVFTKEDYASALAEKIYNSITKGEDNDSD